MSSIAVLTSPRNLRFVRYVLVAFFLWYISVQTFHFFNVSLPSEDHTEKNGLEESPKDERLPEEESGSKLNLHHYREDGFLEVNPEGRHPILELMERAEQDWKAKLERASTSLEDAVKEYKTVQEGSSERWEYVKKHNIQLPDEYDEIHLDLQPFWGISPSDLLAIRKELEEKKDSYTIGKTEFTNVTIVRTSFREELYHQLIKGTPNVVDLLRDIEEYLPPFHATFSPHGGPNRLSDFEVKDIALEAASIGRLLTRENLPKASSLGWLSACSPT